MSSVRTRTERGILSVIVFTGLASAGLTGCDYWPPALQTQVDGLLVQLNDVMDDRLRLEQELEELRAAHSSLQREAETTVREKEALQDRLTAMRHVDKSPQSAKAAVPGGRLTKERAASTRSVVRSPIHKESFRPVRLEHPHHRGVRVTELQQLLRRHDLPIRIDGVYGQNTAAAVRWFQNARGLRVNGVADQATYAALRRPAHPTKPTRHLWLQRPPLRGRDVAEVQRALRRAGYRIAIDGQFGPQTDVAITRFQQKQGLEPDGMVGTHTWTALMRSALR